MARKIRRFGGRIYRFRQSWASKRRAKIEAGRLRDKGFLARVIPSTTLFIERRGDRPKPRWNIYTRRR